MTAPVLDLEALAAALLPVTLAAGDAIMRHYAAGVSVVQKSDGSPTTAADADAEAIITAALVHLTPAITVVAEEAMEGSTAPAIADGVFWLVDPLDGTREFIGRTGQFTVNIALIQDGRPVLGIVYVPAERWMYWGTATGGAFRQQVWQGERAAGETLPAAPPSPQPSPLKGEGAGPRVRGSLCKDRPDVAPSPLRGEGDGQVLQPLQPCMLPQRLQLPATLMPPYRAVMSHSHGDRQGILTHFSRLPLGDIVRAGSSLKFCRVAEGAADFYPRLGPTMEWDTAAGQAVLEAAGGVVTRLDGTPFRYQKADWRNPGFVAFHPAIPVFGQIG
jgi:3'-phosphoadenosine 5'-phosphosulfate (PAPS) 3'-phosphatase